jgi:translocation and assembly module TamB
MTPPASKTLRRGAAVFAHRLILIAAVIAALVWAAGREPVLRWAAEQGAAWTGGRLTLTGVQGSIYGPIRVDTLRYATRDFGITAKGIEFDWAPLTLLLRDRLVVQGLRIREIDIHVARFTEEPLPLPTTLRLPFALDVRPAQVERVVVRAGETRLEFPGLYFTLENPGERYRLAVSRLETPWGNVGAELRLGASPPYALGGEGVLARSKDGLPYAADFRLGGTLERATLDAAGKMALAEGSARVLLTPFARKLWSRAEVTVRNLDPAKLAAGWPTARITLGLAVRMKEDGAIDGSVKAENALPGPFDRDRLPWRKLESGLGGKPEHLRLTDIVLDLGEAGRFSGSGTLWDRRLDLDLATPNLNLHGLHGRLNATRLAGTIRARAEAEGQTLRADLAQGPYRVRVDAARRGERLEIRAANLRAGGGELALSGDADLSGPHPFRAKGVLRRFNPAAFGDYPAADLNASLTLSGRLRPTWQTELALELGDSRFLGQTLGGRAQVAVSAQRLAKADLSLRLGENRLSAEGALGAPGDRLQWRLEAENLGAFQPGWAGRISASGAVAGTFGQPYGSFAATAADLRLPEGRRLARLSAQGRLDNGWDGPLAVEAQLSGYRSGRITVSTAGLAVQGTRADHRATLRAGGPDFAVRAEVQGGWREGAGWRGWLTVLENQGRYPFALKSAATLAAAPGLFRLRDAAVQIGGGTAQIFDFSLGNGGLMSRGELRGLPAAYLLPLADIPLAAGTSLTLGGNWSVEAGEHLNGELTIHREQGDAVMDTEPPIALGLTRAVFQAQARQNRITVRLDAAGAKLGTLAAALETEAQRREGVWGIPGAAPLRMTGDAVMPSIAWLAAWAGGNLALGGSLRADFRAAGSIARPEFAGTLRGEELRLALPEQGVDLRDGSLMGELQGDRLRGSFAFSGGKGRLLGEGSLELVGERPTLRIDLTADKLALLARPDRRVTVSGKGNLAVQGTQTEVRGKFRADEGLIRLPRTDAPALSPDVVVLGRPAAAKKETAPYPARVDLELDFGEQFYLRGRGLDTQLGGALAVRRTNGGPLRAAGNIRVVKGSYDAYGQRLAIERGVLAFSGPFDDPGLDILALRKNLPVEAGVAITGSAMAPRIKLVSNPSVPDTEKLSWLVLGHGLEGTARSDFNLLQTAAGALLARGESMPLEAQIARAAGLDELSLRGAGGLESTVVTLGKRLSSRAYVTFQQGVAGTASLVKINYTLSRRWSLQTQTGTESAVDLFYTLSFD